MIEIKKQLKPYVTLCLLAIIIFFLINPLASGSMEKYSATALTSFPKELHDEPSAAIFNETVHVVWTTKHTEFVSKIYYKRSLDNGISWGNTTKLSLNTTNAVHPKIAVHNETAHVIWVDYRDNKSELYYTRSKDNGESWSTPQRLTNTTDQDPYGSRTTFFYDISIATSDSQVFIIWKDYSMGTSEIFFKKSNDNGDSWEENQRLTKDYHPSYYPSFVVQGSNLYIVYEDWGKRANICLLTSSDYGDTWTSKKFITDQDANGDSKYPNLAVVDNKLYLVWQDDRTGYKEIYFKKSHDGGETWMESQQLTFNSILSTNPKIYLSEEVMVIWQDRRNGSFHIMYKTSLDNGETWNESQMLVSQYNCNDISIVGQDENIHIIWQAYYQPGWGDIWHMGIQITRPIITNFIVSPSVIYVPDSINITVNGEDLLYNKSELNCEIQYFTSSNNWEELDVEFKNNLWESSLLFTESLENCNYSIRARLTNPEGYQSKWHTFDNLTVSSNPSPSGTPGFEIIPLIFVTLFFIIFHIYHGNRKKKK